MQSPAELAIPPRSSGRDASTEKSASAEGSDPAEPARAANYAAPRRGESRSTSTDQIELPLLMRSCGPARVLQAHRMNTSTRVNAACQLARRKLLQIGGLGMLGLSSRILSAAGA